MKTTRLRITILVATLMLGASAATGAEPMGTGFTYQGQLKENSTPVDASCDFKFMLFDDASAGLQVGSTITCDGPPGDEPPIDVVNGLFTVALDFGADILTGEARWLDIEVRCPHDPSDTELYTTLSPRQGLTPAPYALALPGLWTQQNVQSPNLIGGYSGNSVTPGVQGATVGGGGQDAVPNRVTDSFGTVSGGTNNRAGDDDGTTSDAPWATVGGGQQNTASASAATVCGGNANIADGNGAAVGGGILNEAGNSYATVGGGLSNAASGDRSTVGGGGGNIAAGGYSAVGGGWSNEAYGGLGVISGGYRNTAEGFHSAIGGGSHNHVGPNGHVAVIAGGGDNTAEGHYSAIGGGFDNHVTTNGFAAVIPGGEDNTAEGEFSFAAGRHAKANHDGAFVWADSTDAEFASTANDQFLVRATGGVLFDVGGGRELRVEPDAPGPNVIVRAAGAVHFDVGTAGHGLRIEPAPYDVTANIIGGCSDNSVDPSVEGATIAGGGRSEAPNTVTADAQMFGTVSGGFGNTVGGFTGTVGGGGVNTASGTFATVPGGLYNSAQGDYSFAAGRRATVLADHHGAFLWADGNDQDFLSTAANEFAVRCTGGARFVLAVDREGDSTAGVELSPGGGAWSSMSDRNAKDNFQPVDGRDVLDRLAGVPVATWNYKTQDSSVRHLGPVAQDFYAAFGVGEDDKHISTVDADGVALAAIQGLHQIVKEKDTQITAQREQIDTQQEQIADLTARLARIEAMLAGQADAQNGAVR